MQMTASPPVSGLLRRTKLRHFLRARRAQISPEEVGLVNMERRRTPGLRREEVAALAGVGVSWYTWLEQGRDINVSEEIVNAVGNALRLEGCEREYFYRLAGHNPPQRTESNSRDIVYERMCALVEGWASNPAYITDRYGRIEMASRSARFLFRVNASGDNCVVKFFTDAPTREKYPDAAEVARGLVAQFRAQSARFPDDPEFDRIAESLCERSPHFAELWECHEVDDRHQNVRKIAHPQAGVMVFDRLVMRVPECPESLLTLYVAQPGTGLAEQSRGLVGAHAEAA
ncbi:Helix-turn-helix domain-containing protein [Streptomyces sp. yr375]|uniref:helix-turn-helix transcriptional regulator n=1 Tax=Streptomyces sp. yr375 TaxID=1761906 RepID=UPI0008AC87FA|nr:Helix-turn-helix domain-containing protein [Streptomyces sp. yr375]